MRVRVWDRWLRRVLMALMVSKVNCHKRGHRTSRRGRGASRARARQGGGRTDTGRGKTGVTTTKTKTTCLQIRTRRIREHANTRMRMRILRMPIRIRIYEFMIACLGLTWLTSLTLPCCHAATLHACCSAINSARNNTIGPTHTAGTHFCRTTPNRPMNRPMSCPLAALASFIGT